MDHTEPPANFALLVGIEIGLQSAAPIAMVLDERPPQLRTQVSGTHLSFVFNENQVTYSTTLAQNINNNEAQVAGNLGVSSISGHTPSAPTGGNGGNKGKEMSGAAIAGLVIGLVGVAAFGAFVYYIRRKKQNEGRYARRAMTGSMIQEDGNSSAMSPTNERRESGALVSSSTGEDRPQYAAI